MFRAPLRLIPLVCAWVLAWVHGSAFAGSPWRNLDLRGMGFVTGLSAHPSSGEVYARTDVAGVFRWDPVSARWQSLLDATLNSVPEARNVEAFAVDPADPARLFVAYGTYVEDGAGGDGLLRSTDGGLTWTRSSFPAGVALGGNNAWRHAGDRLVVDPANSAVVYFGSRRNGLLRSLDGGASWSSLPGVPLGDHGGETRNGQPASGGVTFVAIHPATTTSSGGPLRSATIYLGIMGEGVFRSLDGGVNFALLGAQPGAVSPDATLNPVQGRLASDGTLYVTLSPDQSLSGGGAVWRWRAGSWTTITPPVSGFTYSARPWAALAIDPTNANRLAVQAFNTASRDLFLSADAGATWTIYTSDSAGAFSPGRHRLVQHIVPAWWDPGHLFSYSGGLLFAPGAPHQIWSATGYAAYLYEDLAAPLVRVNALDYMAGLEELVATRVLPRPASLGGGVLAGVMDKAGFVLADPSATPRSRLGSLPIANSTGLGVSAGTATLVVSLIAHSHDGGQILASDDGGQTWRALAKPFGYADGYGMTLGGDVAVSATQPGRFVWIPLNPPWYPNEHPPIFSADGGATWQLAAGLPDRFNGTGNAYFGHNQLLAADAVDGLRFYAFHEGSSGGSIYRSTDGGATWQVTGLNQLPAFWRTILQARPGVLGELWYTNTTNTLRRSRDGGTTWQALPGWTSVLAYGFGARWPGSAHTTVYAIGERGGVFGLYYSTDDAATWTSASAAATGDAPYRLTLSVCGDLARPGRVYLATGGRGLFQLDLLVSAAHGFPVWLANEYPTLSGADLAPEADPDADGWGNFAEYALAGHASAPAAAPLVRTERSAGGALSLVFNRARQDVRYVVEASTNLSTWTELVVDPGQLGQTVTVIDTVAPAPSAPRFLRLRLIGR